MSCCEMYRTIEHSRRTILNRTIIKEIVLFSLAGQTPIAKLTPVPGVSASLKRAFPRFTRHRCKDYLHRVALTGARQARTAVRLDGCFHVNPYVWQTACFIAASTLTGSTSSGSRDPILRWPAAPAIFADPTARLIVTFYRMLTGVYLPRYCS
jgi:hypothetical protein